MTLATLGRKDRDLRGVEHKMHTQSATQLHFPPSDDDDDDDLASTAAAAAFNGPYTLVDRSSIVQPHDT